MAERSPVEGMRLGVCYNVFDSEELLEQSVRSIRAAASFVCVVYQTISNFGAPCNPGLETMLTSLVSAGLVDEIVRLEPQSPIDAKTKRAIVSRYATEIDTGGPAEHIAEQFINETMKREAGRLKCLAAGCTHVMSMDADEFYIHDELVAAMRLILQHGYEATACRMRTYFKEPIYEFFPPDDLNGVPFIFLLRDDLPFKMVVPSIPYLLDPTRKVDTSAKFIMFDRSIIEMHHMSFVRRNIRMKLSNVSNRANYTDVDEFVQRFEVWSGPEMGVIHPHPYIGRSFHEVRVVPNLFGVDLRRVCEYCLRSNNNATKRCARCKTVYYCGAECQRKHWPTHKPKCKATP